MITAKTIPEKPNREEFAAYKRVQDGGRHIMFAPEAQQATGLSDQKFAYCIAHHIELTDEYKELDA